MWSTPSSTACTRQTGLLEFRVARLPEHEHLLDQVQEVAEEMEQSSPEQAQRLIRRWTGDRQLFAAV